VGPARASARIIDDDVYAAEHIDRLSNGTFHLFNG
jgi:hypothetical protein